MKILRQRGAQVIEFALVLPFLLLLLFLIIDFGFLVYNKAVLTNASREAARHGTVLTAEPWSEAAVKLIACNYAKGSLISTLPGTHTDDCTGDADPKVEVFNPNAHVPPQFGDPITVQITYTYAGFLTPLTRLLLPVDPWTLVAETRMNHE